MSLGQAPLLFVYLKFLSSVNSLTSLSDQFLTFFLTLFLCKLRVKKLEPSNLSAEKNTKKEIFR